MKRNLLSVLALVYLLCFTATAKSSGQEGGEEIFYADPAIYVENGKYYLTGTRTKGFLILESLDLETWKSPMGKMPHLILEKGKGTFGSKGFWAPQIFQEDAKYYMTYYLIYSANHFMNVDYAVGYATSDSPYGPWTKYPKNPILHRSLIGENGTGHGDVFKGKDHKLYYVFHVHHSATRISPRRTRIVPLRLKWDEALNIYDISIDKHQLIIPRKVEE